MVGEVPALLALVDRLEEPALRLRQARERAVDGILVRPPLIHRLERDVGPGVGVRRVLGEEDGAQVLLLLVAGRHRRLEDLVVHLLHERSLGRADLRDLELRADVRGDGRERVRGLVTVREVLLRNLLLLAPEGLVLDLSRPRVLVVHEVVEVHGGPDVLDEPVPGLVARRPRLGVLLGLLLARLVVGLRRMPLVLGPLVAETLRSPVADGSARIEARLLDRADELVAGRVRRRAEPLERGVDLPLGDGQPELAGIGQRRAALLELDRRLVAGLRLARLRPVVGVACRVLVRRLVEADQRAPALGGALLGDDAVADLRVDEAHPLLKQLVHQVRVV